MNQTKEIAGSPVKRTQDELLARIKEADERDLFGFESQEYIACLDADNVKPYLKEGVTGWTPQTLESIDKMAKGYLQFFLEKIENERGISVHRAVAHFVAWKWLLGHSDADTFPGSIKSDKGGGYYQRDAYDYLKAQVDSGEWDKMTVR